jgi:hypothetical protein
MVQDLSIAISDCSGQVAVTLPTTTCSRRKSQGYVGSETTYDWTILATPRPGYSASCFETRAALLQQPKLVISGGEYEKGLPQDANITAPRGIGAFPFGAFPDLNPSQSSFSISLNLTLCRNPQSPAGPMVFKKQGTGLEEKHLSPCDVDVTFMVLVPKK